MKNIEDIANVGHSIVSKAVKSVRRETDIGKIRNLIQFLIWNYFRCNIFFFVTDIKPEFITHVIKNVVDLHKLIFPVNDYIEILTSDMEHIQHEVQEIHPFWHDIKPHIDHASKSIDVLSNGFTIIADYSSAIMNQFKGVTVGSSQKLGAIKCECTFELKLKYVIDFND